MLFLALSPISAVLVYIYVKDKIKEPKRLLTASVLSGCAVIMPIIFSQTFLKRIFNTSSDFYEAFIVASLTEELFKLIAAVIIFKTNTLCEPDEPFDFIVYCVFVSMGFALAENMIYVFSPLTGGIYTAVLRGVTAVPAHTVFGINMGYYLLKGSMIKAFSIPFALHGFYDLFVFKNFTPAFILLMIFMLVGCAKKINLQ